MRHDIHWHTPSPLWTRVLDAGASSPLDLEQPALLRFTSDDFMGELERVLAARPEQLAKHLARPETWSRPGAGWPAAGAASTLKLYQPSQGRFYLVAANLVCRRPGLPDRKIDAAAEESAAFLVRRLVPKTSGGQVDPTAAATFDEEGWIGDRQSGTWTRIADPKKVAVGEERLPLFPVIFRQEGRRRRLLAGFVPAAAGEIYDRRPSAASPDELTDDPLGDERAAEFRAAVAPGFTQLQGETDKVGIDLLREAFLFALLDLADFLEKRLPKAWQALEGASAQGLSGAAEDLYDLLDTAAAGGKSWRELLVDVDTNRRSLLSETSLSAFLAGTLSRTQIENAAAALVDDEDGEPLGGHVADALEEAPAAATTRTTATTQTSAAAPAAPFLVLRCVYERPRCKAFRPPVVSAPTRPFRFAAVFDPDAPARPIRIPLPADTSLKGLRQYTRKGVSFLVSNALRKQMGRVAGATLDDLDSGELGEPGDDGGSGLGTICSFSIPIITICAFLLLMIIVQLLNNVFFWLPLFRICLPFKK